MVCLLGNVMPELKQTNAWGCNSSAFCCAVRNVATNYHSLLQSNHEIPRSHNHLKGYRETSSAFGVYLALHRWTSRLLDKDANANAKTQSAQCG